PPPAPDVRADHARDRDAGRNRDHRQLRVVDALVDVTAQLSQLRLNVVARNFLVRQGVGRLGVHTRVPLFCLRCASVTYTSSAASADTRITMKYGTHDQLPVRCGYVMSWISRSRPSSTKMMPKPSAIDPARPRPM